jgi:GAF domain-containing protein
MNGEDKDRASLQILRESAHKLSATLDEIKIIELLLQQSTTALNARGGLVRMLAPDGKVLTLAGSIGLSQEYLDKGTISLEQSEIDRRVFQNEVVIIKDVTQEPQNSFQYREAAAQEGLKGLITVPLQVRERSIGILRVYLDDVEVLTEADILLLRTLADVCALTLEKIRLHLSMLRISEALNSSLELDTMLKRVLEATVREMELKAASIRLLHPKKKSLRLVAAHGLSENYLAKGDVEISKSPVDQQALNGEVVILYDVESENGFQYPEEAAREGIRSVLVVPLRVKDRTLGIRRAYSGRPRHFGDVAVHFLTSVTNLVGLAIENAQLYSALQDRYDDLKLDLADWYRFLALG